MTAPVWSQRPIRWLAAIIKSGWLAAIVKSEGAPIALLIAYTAAFYRQFVFQGRALVDYDVLTYFYPNLAYAAETLRQGHIPLWNPYLFAGAPFLANMQTAIFYPPNWLYLLIPMPHGYSWSIVLHGLLAATGAYASARGVVGTGRIPGIIAGLAYASGGYVSGLITHLNQMQAAAWLPWLFLMMALALRRQRTGYYLAAATIVALEILAGHAQIVYIGLVGLGLYMLYWLFEVGFNEDARIRLPWRRRIWLLLAAGGALALGGGLAAVQILPALELSRLSVRAGGLTYQEATTFSVWPHYLIKSLMPLYGEGLPSGEWVAYSGVSTLALAVAGVVFARRKPWFWMAMAVLAVLLAMGSLGPLYPSLFGHLPGLDLFRVPARWLLLYAWAMATLSAVGAQSVIDTARRAGPGWGPAVRRGAVLAAILGVVLIVFAAPRLALGRWTGVQIPDTEVLVVWGGLLAIAVALAAIGRKGSIGLAALLLAGELLVAGSSAAPTEGNLAEAYTSLRPSIAHLRSDPSLFRTLAFSGAMFDPGDITEMKTMLADVLPPQGVYDYVVATKHKETLTPNLSLAFEIPSLDGYDGGVLPLKDYVELKSIFPLSGSAAPDARLREQLVTIPDPAMLGGLNVKYVLMDRTQDLWLEDVYYDTAITTTLQTGQEVVLPASSDYRVTAIGIASRMDDSGAAPEGTVIGSLEAESDDGSNQTIELRAGEHTASGVVQISGQGGGQLAVAGETGAFYQRIPLATPTYLRQVRLRYTAPSGALHLRAVSAIDSRAKAGYPIVVSPDLRLVHLGDVKIYENRRWLPRAYLSHAVAYVAGWQEALELMRQPGFRWGEETTVEDATPAAIRPAQGASEAVDIARYSPEEMVIQVTAASPGLLVLSDAYYPGWRAWVDDEERPILRANHSLRGVALDAGQHRVVFRFQPESVRTGGIVTVVCLMALVGLAGIAVRRSGRGI